MRYATTRKRIVRAVALIALAFSVATQCQPQTRIERRIAPTPTIETQAVKTNFVYYFPQASAVRSAKKGAAITMLVDPLEACDDARVIGATWFYVWGRIIPNCAGIEGVSMFWGAGDVGGKVNGASVWLLEFNEPDLREQSGIDPERAAVLIRQIEQDNPGRLFVSPAPSQLHPGWLGETRDAYHKLYGEAPRWDALALHCYAENHAGIAICKDLVEMIAGWAEAWNARGVWLTEFAIAPGAWLAEAEAIALEAQWIDELDADPRVLRYAHFVNRWNDDLVYCNNCERIALVNAGKPTRFGAMYQMR